METTLEVIGYFCNIRDIDVFVLFVILGKLQVHFLREEILEEEVHQLGVLLLLEVIISEHGDATAYH